ncbi:MAG TPA: Fis family transcriptional regulator, partial [Archangium sp.]|nr:Fis family transcriptional regulator [Archangium sp.]
MTPRGYREEELVANRASVLLSGGTEDERRTWAATAARNFS